MSFCTTTAVVNSFETFGGKTNFKLTEMYGSERTFIKSYQKCMTMSMWKFYFTFHDYWKYTRRKKIDNPFSVEEEVRRDFFFWNSKSYIKEKYETYIETIHYSQIINSIINSQICLLFQFHLKLND